MDYIENIESNRFERPYSFQKNTNNIGEEFINYSYNGWIMDW